MTIHQREYNLANSPTWLLRIAHVLFPRDHLISLILLRRRVLAGARTPDNLRKLGRLREKVTAAARGE